MLRLQCNLYKYRSQYFKKNTKLSKVCDKTVRPSKMQCFNEVLLLTLHYKMNLMNLLMCHDRLSYILILNYICKV